MNSPSMSGSQPNRLADVGLIDRSQPLTFRFDGRRYAGYAGDTLASALLASGVKLIGRSFKYHRPRGVVCAGADEPNALVELRAGSRLEPNTRATLAELFDGLEACSQHRWPSLSFDLGALNSMLAPLLVAGFYYKTFMWPASMWERFYEPMIRRAAGLGHASTEADPDLYEKEHAFCDLLVIGGGPAGLSAALAAGRSGARVILCDDDFMPGGRLNGDRREIDGMSGSAWARAVETELAALPEVRVLRRTSVFGVYDDCTFGALERVADHMRVPAPHQPRQRLWKIVARRMVLAAGATERPIVFGGNDRPGVMMSSAVRTYLNRFGVAAGSRIVLFTATDDAWTTAIDLLDRNVAVEAIIDARSNAPASLVEAAKRRGVQVLLGTQVVATHGARSLRHVTVRSGEGRLIRLRADVLAVSGGWNPNIGLSSHLGARPLWSERLCAFVAGAGMHRFTVVGAANGSFRLSDALQEGAAAGAEAAESTGHRAAAMTIPKVAGESSGVTAFWHVAESKGKAFVDFQNDVTYDDIAIAVREGFSSVELLKRYTTLGMGTDQGRTSNVNGLAILARLTGREISETGTTTARPPLAPVSIGAFAGHHRGKMFKPTRRTASHVWAQECGATFVEASQWLRARWFATDTEQSWFETVAREVTTVRSSVGVCDVSTLGKIDVQGPDAGVFLDKVYVNTFSTLPVGKTRYGLMLREDGFVLDDGTSARLAADHYVMSTTTANAGRVMQHLEYARQVLWPDLDVQIVSVTEQWAQYAVAGPNSRRLLQRLLGNVIALADVAFPYLACAQFCWRDMIVRLFRVSFSGELAYELAVPARYGDAVIRAIMTAGADLGIVPYGTEAIGVMRIEKGHVAGNEINGMTTAADLGLGRMMSNKKDFIGRVLAAREGLAHPRRATLVGVKAIDKEARFFSGAHFLARGADVSLANDQGYLTSVAFSPMLGVWIGLGLLQGGSQRWGERIRAYDPIHGSDVEVEVVSPAFFDPEGERLRG